MRNCTECGTPLHPGMTICPRCGKYTPDLPPTSMNVDEKAMAAQAKYQAPFTVATSANSQPPTYDSRVPYFQQAPLPQASMPYARPAYTMPYQTSSPPRKAISKGTILLLSIMALLMMIGGVALIYYSAVAQPAQFRAQATATVQTILTNQTHATATAQAQATVTAQAQAHATATAQTLAQATATSLQNVYNTTTSGAPALTSPLAFQDGASWDIYDAIGGGGCAFNGGALHASIFQQHTYVPCFAQATNFSNFVFQVQMTIVKGDSGGVVFRADSTTAKFYLFRIARDGTFTLLLIKDTKTDTPLVEDTNPAVKTGGKPNLVTIIARGGTIYMYINKQFVDSISDNTYTMGKIGIFADDTTAATDVAFSDVNVWTL